MTIAQALSGDARLTPPPARETLTVLTAGGTAANLLDSTGRLWSLGSRHVPDAPGMWTLDLDDVVLLELSPGSVVPLRDGRLRCAGATVELRGARPWEPPPRSRIADPTAAAGLVRRTVGTCAPGTLRPAEGDMEVRASPAQAAVVSQLNQRAARLLAAARAGDRGAVMGAARSLLGLGPGLTPSGDDWLAGLVLTLRHLDDDSAPPPALPPSAVRAAAREAVQPGLTTVVSEHMLQHALDGRGARPLHNLLAALAELDPTGAASAVEALLRIGHTSGSDQLCGVLAALDLFPTQGASCLPRVM